MKFKDNVGQAERIPKELIKVLEPQTSIARVRRNLLDPVLVGMYSRPQARLDEVGVAETGKGHGQFGFVRVLIGNGNAEATHGSLEDRVDQVPADGLLLWSKRVGVRVSRQRVIGHQPKKIRSLTRFPVGIKVCWACGLAGSDGRF